jgi:hypothetical protein
MGNQPLRALLGLVALIAAACLVPGASTAAGGRPSSQKSALSQFPLWSVLPSSSFAVLDESVLKQRRWGFYAFRNGKLADPRTPCVELVGAMPFKNRGVSVLRGGATCGLLESSGRPLINVMKLERVGATVLGIAVGTDVHRVEISMERAVSEVHATRLLSVAQARKARIPRFRYLALNFSHDVCITQISGFDAAGSIAFQTPSRRCGQARPT